ncbi:hypothetical protein MRB53_038436 [Persea americana]|nr:hypothetical protein MRB53_038436 [Persea americana]
MQEQILSFAHRAGPGLAGGYRSPDSPSSGSSSSSNSSSPRSAISTAPSSVSDASDLTLNCDESATPPQFKRHESTLVAPQPSEDVARRQLVERLVDSGVQLLHTIWPRSDCHSGNASLEVGQRHGFSELRTFVRETLKRTNTSHSTLQVTLFNLVLLKAKVGIRPDADVAPVFQCGRRMFLAALMLASKYLQDRNFSAKAWSKMSGLSTQEINLNETSFLRAVDFRLHIEQGAFEKWTALIRWCTNPSPFASDSEGSVLHWKPLLSSLDEQLRSTCSSTPSQIIDMLHIFAQNWRTARYSASKLSHLARESGTLDGSAYTSATACRRFDGSFVVPTLYLSGPASAHAASATRLFTSDPDTQASDADSGYGSSTSSPSLQKQQHMQLDRIESAITSVMAGQKVAISPISCALAVSTSRSRRPSHRCASTTTVVAKSPKVPKLHGTASENRSVMLMEARRSVSSRAPDAKQTKRKHVGHPQKPRKLRREGFYDIKGISGEMAMSMAEGEVLC